MPWIFIIVALVTAAALMAAVWFFLLRRANRPQVLQNIIDMRKRLKGPPTSGTVSLVITDIEGFSGENREGGVSINV